MTSIAGSTIVRCLASIVVVIAGSDATFRPLREVETRANAIWPVSFMDREHRVGVALATLLLIAIVWLV